MSRHTSDGYPKKNPAFTQAIKEAHDRDAKSAAKADRYLRSLARLIRNLLRKEPKP